MRLLRSIPDRPLYLRVSVYVLAVLAAAGATWMVMRRHPTSALFATSWAVVVAVPRFLVYDLTYLLVGGPEAIRSIGSSSRTAEMRRPQAGS